MHHLKACSEVVLFEYMDFSLDKSWLDCLLRRDCLPQYVPSLSSNGMQYFADRDIFCAGRVAEDDLQRVASATGAQVQTTVNNLVPEVLGACNNFEERQVGSERFNIFTGCPQAKTATIILRGGAEQVCYR